MVHRSENRAAKYLANEFIWTTFLDCIFGDYFNISIFSSADVLCLLEMTLDLKQPILYSLYRILQPQH